MTSKTCSPKTLRGSRCNRTTSGRPADQSTPLTNATMNPSNADASVNSVEAGIRGCVNAGATAANSTGVNAFCSIHPSIHPSVSQSDVMSHPRQRQNVTIPHLNILAPTPRFAFLMVHRYLGENNLVPKFSRLFRTKPNQRYLEGERGLRLSVSFARFNDC